MRGVAVAAVLLFHAQYGFARGGFLGVSAFFTLSGFLITSLLLAERARGGRVSLRRFWARRARRLLPAAFTALAGIIVFGAFVADDGQRASLKGDLVGALFYVANWRFVFHHQSYAQIFDGAQSPVLHFWSLAIEEQYYLIFPLLAAGLLAFGRGRARVLGAVIAVLTVASVATSAVLAAGTSDITRTYYGTDTRAAELLLGALLAIVVSRRRAWLDRWRYAVAAAGVVAVAVMLVMWSRVDRTDHWLYQGGFALHACVAATVLAACLVPGPVAAVFALRPLRWLGRISYGVYLYHWPIFLWISPARLPDAGRSELFALRIALTLAVAVCSFHLVERPIRRQERLVPWVPRVALPAVVVILFTCAWVVPPDASRSITYTAIARGSGPLGAPAGARGPQFPALPANAYHRAIGHRPLRILVVGDSVGATLGRGFESYAMRTQQWQVWNDGHYYCSLARFARRIAGPGVVDDQARVCNDWGTRWKHIVDTFDPDVTFVLYTLWEQVARRPPGASHMENPGDARYDRWQLAEYRAAADLLSSRGGKVVWLTAPCRIGANADTGKPELQTYPYVNGFLVPGVARQRPNAVRVVDLDAEICAGGRFHASFAGVEDFRPDGAHFSDDGAQAVARWLMHEIS